MNISTLTSIKTVVFALGLVIAFSSPVQAAKMPSQVDFNQLARSWTWNRPFSIPGLISKPVMSAFVIIAGGRHGAPRGGGTRTHQGVDYAAPVGTPVLAMLNGVVTAVLHNSGLCGNGVEIMTGGLRQFFCHVRPTAGLRRGQRVQAGQRIGYIDMSGSTTGPHAHVELWENGRSLDLERVFRDPQALARFAKASAAQGGTPSFIAQNGTPSSQNQTHSTSPAAIAHSVQQVATSVPQVQEKPITEHQIWYHLSKEHSKHLEQDKKALASVYNNRFDYASRADVDLQRNLLMAKHYQAFAKLEDLRYQNDQLERYRRTLQATNIITGALTLFGIN